MPCTVAACYTRHPLVATQRVRGYWLRVFTHYRQPYRFCAHTHSTYPPVLLPACYTHCYTVRYVGCHRTAVVVHVHHAPHPLVPPIPQFGSVTTRLRDTVRVYTRLRHVLVTLHLYGCLHDTITVTVGSGYLPFFHWFLVTGYIPHIRCTLACLWDYLRKLYLFPALPRFPTYTPHTLPVCGYPPALFTCCCCVYSSCRVPCAPGMPHICRAAHTRLYALRFVCYRIVCCGSCTARLRVTRTAAPLRFWVQFCSYACARAPTLCSLLPVHGYCTHTILLRLRACAHALVTTALVAYGFCLRFGSLQFARIDGYILTLLFTFTLHCWLRACFTTARLVTHGYPVALPYRLLPSPLPACATCRTPLRFPTVPLDTRYRITVPTGSTVTTRAIYRRVLFGSLFRFALLLPPAYRLLLLPFYMPHCRFGSSHAVTRVVPHGYAHTHLHTLATPVTHLSLYLHPTPYYS